MWTAFVALDRQRATVVNPRGQEIPLPLAMNDIVAYGRAMGLCYTVDATSDYLVVVQALDEDALAHRRRQLRAAAEAANTPPR